MIKLVLTMFVLIMFNLFLLMISICAIVDVSMPLFTGSTLNLTSNFFRWLGFNRISNCFNFKLRKG